MEQGTPTQPPDHDKDDTDPSLFHISLRGNYCSEWKRWFTADQQASIFNELLQNPEIGEPVGSTPGLYVLVPKCAANAQIVYIVDGIEVSIFHVGPSNITYQARPEQSSRIHLASQRLFRGIAPFAYEVAAHGTAYGLIKVIEHAIK